MEVKGAQLDETAVIPALMALLLGVSRKVQHLPWIRIAAL